MHNLRYYYRRFLIYRFFEGQQRRMLLLYLLNFSLGLILALQYWNKPTRSPTMSFVDSYRKDISYAMEAFDFMYHQKLAAKPIPPPEDVLGQSFSGKYCPRLSQDYDLNSSVRWNNLLWQSASSKSEIYLYSAYFDDRPNAIFPSATCTIQVLGVVWRHPSSHIYCRIWNTDYSSILVKALVREIWQRAWDPRDHFYVPVLFTCPLSFVEGTAVPAYVSLVEENTCSMVAPPPSSFLPIHSHKTKIIKADQHDKKAHTVVCVKGMDFLDDLSYRFVEWLELNYQVGADKVVIYTYSVHPRMRKVIEHYASKTGRLEHIPLTLPGHAPNSPLHRSRFIKRNRQQKRRHELIPYNDCLYRHIGSHEYVLIVDVDELVVPIRHQNWEDMINDVKRTNKDTTSWTAFSIANAFFFDNQTTTKENISSVHILNHSRRSRRISPPGIYGKSFMDTRNVATVFNHFPLHKQRLRLDSNLRPTYYVDPNLARKNHYKAECPIESRDECPDLYRYTVEDHSATRYTQHVAPKIQAALKAMGIDPKNSPPPLV